MYVVSERGFHYVVNVELLQIPNDCAVSSEWKCT
jgi:hypothetical protein